MKALPLRPDLVPASLCAYRRRAFLARLAAGAAGLPWAGEVVRDALAAPAPSSRAAGAAAVAITRCRAYGAGVRAALDQAFDLLGGVGAVVKNKTVTVKINLTGTNFTDYLGRPVGETYMTHPDTLMALASALFAAGARRLRVVESTQSRSGLNTSMGFAGFDIPALSAMGTLEYENTRNLGTGRDYATLKVPGGGAMFSEFQLNRSYADTDVLVSLCKMKQHITAGVTLAMKNIFGITPNSLYGDQAGTEEATAGRGPIHSPIGHERVRLPGAREGVTSKDPTWRVPQTIVDLNAARPIQLAIIDGITAMSGGEGPWCGQVNRIEVTTPGVLVVGFNAVATDAVGTALMGYADPRAVRGQKPFHFCDNHLLLAEQRGLGTADLARIDVRGLSIAEARTPYKDAFSDPGPAAK